MIPDGPEHVVLGQEGEEQFSLLLSALRAGTGFELLFVCSASRYVLNEVTQRLLRQSSPELLPCALDYGRPEGLRTLLEDLLALAHPSEGRCVACVRAQGPQDEQSAAWTHALVLLNEQRNRLIAGCPSAIVLTGAPDLVTIAQNYAPDLWSVRSSVLIFPEAIQDLGRSSLALPTYTRRHEPMAHELQSGSYYADLAKALEGSPRKAEQITRASLLMRAADAWALRGDTQNALQALEQARAVYGAAKDKLGEARATREQCRIRFHQGEVVEALRVLRQYVLPAVQQLADERERVETLDLIADILYARGDLDGALQIWLEEVLPVHERRGDVRARAATQGKIADILQARGDLDGALRIRQEEQLPVYVRLGDVQGRAMTLGGIADVLRARGDLDGALDTLQTKSLPTFDSLGDVRSRAVTQGKIAGILYARGDLDGALRILQEEDLPIFERLGDARGLLVTRTNTALMLMRRNGPGDREEARRLLLLALEDARRMRIPEETRIEQILQRLEQSP